MAKDLTQTQFSFIPKKEKIRINEDNPLGQRFGGLSIFSGGFKRGSGAEVFGSSKEGIWLGAAEFEDAPARIGMDGSATFTNITLTGFIEEGGAAADVNANVTTIDGGKITANTVTASKINVSQLSAISANIGAITAGTIDGITITGGTIRTSSSGTRVEMNGGNNRLQVYSGGTLRAEFTGQLLQFRDSGGTIRSRLRGVNIAESGVNGFALSISTDTSDEYLFTSAGFISMGGIFEGDVGLGNRTLYWGSSPGNSVSITGSGINFPSTFTITRAGSGRIEIGSSEILMNAHVEPLNGNTYDLGHSSDRWRTIYLVNSPDVSSDIRFKNNIKSLNYGLEEVNKINPISFDRKDNITRLGFSAQELQDILPEIVNNGKQLSIRPDEIIPVLVNAVKELSEKVEKLEKN